MARKRHTDKAQDVNEALRKLYGEGGRDLTSEGYQEALRQLRKADSAGADRVERVLAPYLKARIFRRRQREWHETSEGTRARLALLPGNPHVQADVHTIREVLGIPAGHVHAVEDDPTWKLLSKMVKPQDVRRVVEGNLVGWWLHLHREAAMGQMTGEEDEAGLPPELRASAVASAQVYLKASHVPAWLQRRPDGPQPYDKPSVPIDWASGRLGERHRLPWHVVVSLPFYILTQDPDWLTGLEPLQVEAAPGDSTSGDPEAFTVSVKGIDEFITHEDWDRIWTHFVKPRQEYRWKQRGMKPQGRRTVDIARLQEALPLYREMVSKGWEIKDLLGKSCKDWGADMLIDWDQETKRRVVRDLDELLVPKG